MKIVFFYLFYFFWKIYDRFSIRDFNTWAFCTHHLHTNLFIENQRAVFNHLKKDDNIKKIVFYRGSRKDFFINENDNCKVVKFGTIRSFFILSRCKVIFLSSSISMEYSMRWKENKFFIVKPYLKNRIIINMGHGISIKKILTSSNRIMSSHFDRVKFRKKERYYYTGIVSSSNLDRCIMAAMYYPASYHQTWLTGMPRSDFLLMKQNDLPDYIKKDIKIIKKSIKGKKLISYLPTYRETKIINNSYYYSFSEEEVYSLKKVLLENNAVLAYRPHYFKNDIKGFNLEEYIDDKLIIDFSNIKIHDITSIIRESDIIVTDYSSVIADAIYLDKPIIGFCYDQESYSKEQNGLLYDLSFLYGDFLCSDFNAVIENIDLIIKKEKTYKNTHMKSILYEYLDTNNCYRLVEKVKSNLQAVN